MSLKVKFRNDRTNRPIFRDVERMEWGMGEASETKVPKALPYHKARDHIVWLGLLMGFEQMMEFYHVRYSEGSHTQFFELYVIHSPSELKAWS